MNQSAAWADIGACAGIDRRRLFILARDVHELAQIALHAAGHTHHDRVRAEAKLRAIRDRIAKELP